MDCAGGATESIDAVGLGPRINILLSVAYDVTKMRAIGLCAWNPASTVLPSTGNARSGPRNRRAGLEPVSKDFCIFLGWKTIHRSSPPSRPPAAPAGPGWASDRGRRAAGLDSSRELTYCELSWDAAPAGRVDLPIRILDQLGGESRCQAFE